MASLTDVYGDTGRAAVAPWRRRVGATAVAVGAALVVLAPVIAAGPGAEWLGHSDARGLAGVLAGVGLPVAVLGVFLVLPASRQARAAAAIGGSLALLGVGLFRASYPDRWISAAPRTALAVIAVYSLGMLVTIWCLFLAVATQKRRRSPGETARVAITDKGTVQLVTSAGNGGGSVGLFGSALGRSDRSTPASQPGTRSSGASTSTTTASDGAGAGAETSEITEVGGVDPDSYCGNCAHFEYVRADGELAPYCGHHERLLEDMDACEAWTNPREGHSRDDRRTVRPDDSEPER